MKRLGGLEHYWFVIVCYERGGIYPMDHEVVVRQKLTEQYLLNELNPQIRDEFEEHYFDCPKCAIDVQAGALFVEQSKIALAEEPAAAGLRRAPVPRPKPGWFAWLRPAFAMPVMALLLAVIGYQNLVTLPQARQAQGQPHVIQSWAMVNVGTYGDGEPVTIAPGKGFMLLVRVPPDAAFVSYIADLYDPAGKREWSLPFPAVAGQDKWPVQVPGANRESGTYQMKVRGVTAAGESKEIGGASFEVKIQK